LLPFGSESFVFLLFRNVKVKIYRTIILPVVLHGSETWSFTLWEEHGLRVFENRMMRRLFGPKMDELTGEWRKFHSGELHNLYSCQNIIRQNKSRVTSWAGHGREEKVSGGLVGKPEGK
jgi:hypothetical protein